jgi:ureidoacrylate peracid hydrolase
MRPFDMNAGYEPAEIPLLIAIEIQREHTTLGRPYFMEGTDESLENCRAVLTNAREKNWSIAHVRHEQPGSIFGQSHAATQFVKGFEPLPHEHLFTKGNFSCYSNPGFEKFMETSRPEQVYLIGYSSLMCCLSTIVEGYHRGHELSFVTDASLARATPNAQRPTPNAQRPTPNAQRPTLRKRPRTCTQPTSFRSTRSLWKRPKSWATRSAGSRLTVICRLLKHNAPCSSLTELP